MTLDPAAATVTRSPVTSVTVVGCLPAFAVVAFAVVAFAFTAAASPAPAFAALFAGFPGAAQTGWPRPARRPAETSAIAILRFRVNAFLPWPSITNAGHRHLDMDILTPIGVASPAVLKRPTHL
ncbi:hypothetical protein Raf01_64400 [Rugosimonospora africana]|uniref:Uncharacterized protein n=1 Tax=Rugosimonospora africana TaxID=556532 RepID=A0A8J3VU53_9ACTN|nr:hypothetical protein Raf01_64400 [Rugosimonospora africana]